MDARTRFADNRAVAARAHRGEGPKAAAEAEELLRERGLSPSRWGNGPGDRYGWHSHDYRKVLYCVEGSIRFLTREEGEIDLRAGDRLEIDPGTEHAAVVGDGGVTCVEAADGS